MTEKVQRRGGFGLVLAVAVGRPVSECAAIGGVSEATVRRRMRDPRFMARVHELQRQMTALAAGKVVSSLDSAIETMKTLLASTNDSVRLGAASRIASLSMQMGELSTLQAKVDQLENLILELTSHEPTEANRESPENPPSDCGTETENGGDEATEGCAVGVDC